MIYLKKGQTLFENTAMVVYDPTGYYNDGDSVICAPAGLPEEPACRYEAKYIAYGGIVYSISDPDQLMEEIMKIDPKNLFGKDTQQVAVDKMVEKIVPQKSEDLSLDPDATANTENTASTTPETNIETPTTDNVVTNTPVDTSTTTQSGVPTTTPSAATTTPTENSTSTTTATTTPDFTLDTSTSTTTPNFNFDTSTTTQSGVPTTTPPEILFETSTTTPAIDTEISSSTLTDILPEVPVVDTVPIIPEVTTPDVISTTTDQIVAIAKKAIKRRILK